jgi:hypothetical protein
MKTDLPEEFQNFERCDFAILVAVNPLEGRVGLEAAQIGKHLALAFNASLALRDRDEEALEELLAFMGQSFLLLMENLRDSRPFGGLGAPIREGGPR